MFAPGMHTEIEEIAGYLELQFQALRNSAYGLSEDQARLTPCRSALSIGGLLKHATYVCEGRARRRRVRAAVPDPRRLPGGGPGADRGAGGRRARPGAGDGGHGAPDRRGLLRAGGGC